MSRVRSWLLVCFALFAVQAQAQNVISTVAGGGPDGVVATDGNLGPRGVRTDGFGTVYIAVAFYSQSDRILQMDTSGQLTVVAGGGIDNGGFRGDGGPAREANLYAPVFGTPDVFGNILIADCFNNRIRKVNVITGKITTVAGTGVYGFSGDSGPAINAQLRCPASVAVDLSGNIFLADAQNNRVRKIDGSTDIITTVAGNGLAGFSGDFGPATSASLSNPVDVAADPFGNVFIADYGNNAIRRVDVETGIITTVAGMGGVGGFSGDGGPPTSAKLFGPSGVALDGDGNLFIADSNNQRIRRVDAVTGNISTVAGNGMIGFSGDGGPATMAKFNTPISIAVDQGNLYIADEFNFRLRFVDGSGNISTVAGNGSANFCCDGYPATSASLFSAEGAAVDPNGNVVITDSGNNRLRMADTSGNISTIAGTGVSGYGGDGGPAINAQFSYPQNVVFDANGNMFFCDLNNNRIRSIDVNGMVTTVAGTGVAGFSGDGGLATAARINFPNGLAIDASGNLFISDANNRRIRKVNAATGIITTIAGSGAAGFSGDGGPATLARFSNSMAGVAVDPSGNVYIADLGNERVRRIDVDTGIINTVAGNGTFGSSGDGGPATAASLANPYGLAIDYLGNLYIGEFAGNRVRRVQFGIITSYAGNGQYGYGGDGGVPNGAALASPSYLSVDSTGGLYLPTASDGRIRYVAP